MRNLKIQYKIALIFIVIILLMVNLGALSITAINEIRNNTNKVTDEFLPRLVATSEIKDSLNISISSAFDYTRTGSTESKKQYEQRKQEAVQAQVRLFNLSKTDKDFEFTQSFQDYINSIDAAQKDVIAAYETAPTSPEVEEKLSALTQQRDAFIQFLDTEIQTRIESEAAIVSKQTQQQLEQTILMVVLASLLACVTMLLLFSFVRRSITEPLGQLTRMAENIGVGNFSVSAAIDSKDELGILAQTLNNMSHHIQEAQRALEEELAKTKQLDQQKTEFLSIAAHQLRTPMSGIKWVVQMTIDGDFGTIDAEAKEQLKKSMENVDRMIILINSLLDVTRLQTQGFDFSFEKGDLLAILHEAEEDLYQAAEKNGVTVTVVPPTQVLPKIRLDKEKMAMVIHNLIDNAVKYTPKGGRVTVGATLVPDNMVAITVADTGYGIPIEEQGRIFSKFFRGSNIQTVQADGSGLGLFMVHEIVKRHGGDIRFVSTEGQGTTFTITIPVDGPNASHPSLHSNAGVDTAAKPQSMPELAAAASGAQRPTQPAPPQPSTAPRPPQ